MPYNPRQSLFAVRGWGPHLTPQDNRTMEHSIRERLSNAEHDFLQAAAQGLPALTLFQDTWNALYQDLNGLSQSSTFDADLSTTWDEVASRIAIMSDHLLDFQNSARTMTSSFEDELDAIFARVDMNDVIDHPPPPSPPTSSLKHTEFSDPLSFPLPPPNDQKSGGHLYIEQAYTWLLKNLHNPYPSKETRSAISTQTGSSRKALDAWFIDARKRVGWNDLRRKHFSNKRMEIVDAAIRFFGGQDPQKPLDESIQFEFLAIEARARELYAEKFSESVLATKLDIVVKDMTPKMKAQAQIDERRRRRQARAAQDRTLRDAQVASFYPSPRRSPSGTPEPLLLSDELDLSIIPSVSVTGHKRNSSPDPELLANRPSKRSRLDIPAGIDFGTTSLPSPALSFNESLPPTDESGNPSVTPISVAPSSRKRRLSDADDHGAPKRPRNILSGPRLHSVSDPLPSTSTLSSWFESHFGISSTITADEPDLSLPFDVELYDYSIAAPQVDPLSGATEPSTYQGMTPPPSFEATLPVPDTPAYPSNITTNSFDYNELFCDPEDDVFGTQGNLKHTNRSWFPTFDPSFSYTKTSLDPTATIPDVAVIADSSALILHDPESNFDWMFPPLLSSDTSDPLNNLGSNDFPQDGTFNAYPSKVALRALGFSDHTAVHASAEATKAAKQRKLMEMKEATRRLEAEIAAS